MTGNGMYYAYGTFSSGIGKLDARFEVSTMKEPTIYPSAYMVLSNRGYTKHYYAGNERVAARIGGGGIYSIDNDTALSIKAINAFNQGKVWLNNRQLAKAHLQAELHVDY